MRLVVLVTVLGLLTGYAVGRAGIGNTIGALGRAIGRPNPGADVVIVSQDVSDQPLAVLGNDRDPNGDSLEIVAAKATEHGVLVVEGNSLLYTPATGFVGTDHGEYTVRDPGGGMATAGIDIRVMPNESPLAVPDAIVAGSSGVELDLLANDLDPDGHELSVVGVGDPAGGRAQVVGGAVRYEPDAGFSGIDIVPYTIADELGLQGSAYVAISVPAVDCTGADDAMLDEDGDLYDNTDEIRNGSDPCGVDSRPADADGDGTSDLADPFLLDPADGLRTRLPVRLDFDAVIDGTVHGTGFSGVMSTGAPPESLVDTDKVSLADGYLHIGSSPSGDAIGEQNSQRNALQTGFRMPAEPFTIHARLHAPFATHMLQSAGIYVGTGDQDNYLKLAVSAAEGDGGVKITYEDGGDGRGAALRRDPSILDGAETVDLYIVIDPRRGTADSFYRVDNGQRLGLGTSGHLPIPASWTDGPRALAVGVVVTSEQGGAAYAGRWDFIEVRLGR